MAEIVLCTLNARYIHSSFGLRYLLANMGELAARTRIAEFVVNDHPSEMLGKLLADSPKLIGFGVYIWNVEATTRLIADLRKVRPDICIVLGGPEVSYETEGQPIVDLADYVITGEADIEFAKLCENLLKGKRVATKIIAASIPEIRKVRLPYELYTDEDIAHRVVYVEASRGCPFTCEFCLSSLEIPVRSFELDAFLAAMQRLMDRGVKQFKFVDRTFNLNVRIGLAILEFFLDRRRPGMFLHFEMIPDRLPEPLRKRIAAFPAGALQFEIGIQTFSDAVGERISRRQDVEKLEENFRFLREETGVHIHADLIVGLPGETFDEFAEGFDRLYRLRPQEIQVGILKRLRGTPIVRHDAEWEMVYSPHPPYEILSTKTLPFETIQELRRFARYWDLVGNSGNFPTSLALLCPPADSAFSHFHEFSRWVYAKQPQLYGISLVRLTELLFEYLREVRKIDGQVAAHAIWSDYGRQHREKPGFLKGFDLESNSHEENSNADMPARQKRHLGRVLKS
jgi:radical SAM superfamily enzyme YgiQ (UPF0313 family)